MHLYLGHSTGVLISLIILVLDVWAILCVLLGSSAIERKLIWTVVILVLPVFGLILYLLLGQSRLDAD